MGSRKMRMNNKIVLAKSILARCCKRPKVQPILNQKKKKKNQNQNGRIDIGDTVDIMDLLFSPDRDFLLKNNGDKVRVDDIKGKAIVLYAVPLYKEFFEQWATLDMMDAYSELLPMGGVEFVFVAIQIKDSDDDSDDDNPWQQPSPEQEEAYFNHLFSTMPFPTIPFSDKAARGRVVEAFYLNRPYLPFAFMPYWSIIDPTNTVVASITDYSALFNRYGGAELYPLNRVRAYTLRNKCYESHKQLNNLDQLLASPTRDYLLASNGIDKVPISSLKDKVVGLYFCENEPSPPRMNLIKKVYQETKLRGYDFEIVQINFHLNFNHNTSINVEDLSVKQCYENINWLIFPFKDPSCRKLLRIFRRDRDDDWLGDCLVIVDQRQRDTNGVRFEFSGAEIFEEYGVEGYPFTRQYLFEIERRRQKEYSVNLKLLFPPGKCQFIRSAGDGCDLIDGSYLSGKRVLVLFASHSECKSCEFISVLESKYYAQLHDASEEKSKFEVVYVSSDYYKTPLDKCIEDMPWLVYSCPKEFAYAWSFEVFKVGFKVGLAAFDVDGELMAKDSNICYGWEGKEYHELSFPFISPDCEWESRLYVKIKCKLDKYY